MSILSWDDFEDDSQKPTAPEHKSASLDRKKRLIRKWYLIQSNHRRAWQLHNPLEPVPTDQQIQPIRWLEHLKP
jgi:hypothetical protein